MSHCYRRGSSGTLSPRTNNLKGLSRVAMDTSLMFADLQRGIRPVLVEIDEITQQWMDIWHRESRGFWGKVNPPMPDEYTRLRRENDDLKIKLHDRELRDKDTVRISKDQAKAIRDLIAVWRYSSSFPSQMKEINRIVSILETEDVRAGTGKLEAIIGLQRILEDDQ